MHYGTLTFLLPIAIMLLGGTAVIVRKLLQDDEPDVVMKHAFSIVDQTILVEEKPIYDPITGELTEPLPEPEKADVAARIPPPEEGYFPL